MDKHIAVTSPQLGAAAAAAPTPPALSLAASSSGKARLTINTASIGLLTEALSSGAEHQQSSRALGPFGPEFTATTVHPPDVCVRELS